MKNIHFCYYYYFTNYYVMLQYNIERIKYIKVSFYSVNFYMFYSFVHLIIVTQYL